MEAPEDQAVGASVEIARDAPQFPEVTAWRLAPGVPFAQQGSCSVVQQVADVVLLTLARTATEFPMRHCRLCRASGQGVAEEEGSRKISLPLYGLERGSRRSDRGCRVTLMDLRGDEAGDWSNDALGIEEAMRGMKKAAVAVIRGVRGLCRPF